MSTLHVGVVVEDNKMYLRMRLGAEMIDLPMETAESLVQYLSKRVPYWYGQQVNGTIKEFSDDHI